METLGIVIAVGAIFYFHRSISAFSSHFEEMVIANAKHESVKLRRQMKEDMEASLRENLHEINLEDFLLCMNEGKKPKSMK